MGEHRTTCAECNREFVQVRIGSGRLAVTCSPACRKERIKRREREQHRFKRGDAFVDRSARGGLCSVDQCTGEVVAQEMCGMHYERFRRTGVPGPALTWQKLCTVIGCTELRYARGWCNMHYLRAVSNNGDPGEPERRKRRNGEGTKDKRKDYITVYAPDGRRMGEHRFVMEQQLGRKLYPEENVHHRNGRRDDNRPENLELWVKPQAAGQRVEDLVAWVIEHYPTFVHQALTQRTSKQP